MKKNCSKKRIEKHSLIKDTEKNEKKIEQLLTGF